MSPFSHHSFCFQENGCHGRRFKAPVHGWERSAQKAIALGRGQHANTSDLEKMDISLSQPSETPLTTPDDSEKEAEGDEPETSPYDRFPSHRKWFMVAVMAWCGLLSPISSTTVLSAIPEVAAEFDTTGSMISLSNAVYLVFMSISTCIWGPLCQVLGRRRVCLLFFSPSTSRRRQSVFAQDREC